MLLLLAKLTKVVGLTYSLVRQALSGSFARTILCLVSAAHSQRFVAGNSLTKKLLMRPSCESVKKIFLEVCDMNITQTLISNGSNSMRVDLKTRMIDVITQEAFDATLVIFGNDNIEPYIVLQGDGPVELTAIVFGLPQLVEFTFGHGMIEVVSAAGRELSFQAPDVLKLRDEALSTLGDASSFLRVKWLYKDEYPTPTVNVVAQGYERYSVVVHHSPPSAPVAIVFNGGDFDVLTPESSIA